MRKNVFAFTPPSNGSELVPYLSLNLEEERRVYELTVRAAVTGTQAVMEVPAAQLQGMAAAIQEELSSPGGPFVTGASAVVDEYLSILCAVKAWRDDPRQAAFPHELRERLDAVAATVAAGAA